jgi:glyoxylase-like metal-dependent hydrolase (beta-lactamase superfamily II)
LKHCAAKSRKAPPLPWSGEVNVKQDASSAGLAGTVHVRKHGGVTLHTYISPEDDLLTNTQIVEGPRKLIVFDGQFFLPYAGEVAIYAESLAKPVDRIILSHIHLDHWSGLSVLSEHFPGVPICGLPGIAEYLHDNGKRILDARRPVFGDRIPKQPTIPTEVLREGSEVIDGVPFEFRRYVDAESALQLVALLPEQRTLLAFDLAFAPNDHVFTVTPHFDHWIAILQELNAMNDYDRILSGHGEPTDQSAINATIDYLLTGKVFYAGSKDASEYATRMKMAFPDRQHPGWIDLSATLLYNAIDAYVTD